MEEDVFSLDVMNLHNWVMKISRRIQVRSNNPGAINIQTSCDKCSYE